MTANEERLLRIVREADDPDAMLAYAVKVILSVLQQPQAYEGSSLADTETHS